jgi:hypothetical protein
MYAGCQGTAQVSPEQKTKLRDLLFPTVAWGDFQVYAETPSIDRQAHFVLYSITNADDSSAATVYLAAISLQPRLGILSSVDVTAYLPSFVSAIPAQPETSFSSTPHIAGSAGVNIDGCLNAFLLQPDLQAVHMNLFARSRNQNEEASDIVFVLLDSTSLRPVLELNQSSRCDKRIHQDSVIAVLPPAGIVKDIIWVQSSQQGGGMMTAAFNQNRWCRWNGRGFDKMGTLEEVDLAARLQSAFRLTRSDEISGVEMKLFMDSPKQPTSYP